MLELAVWQWIMVVYFAIGVFASTSLIAKLFGKPKVRLKFFWWRIDNPTMFQYLVMWILFVIAWPKLNPSIGRHY